MWKTGYETNEQKLYKVDRQFITFTGMDVCVCFKVFEQHL